MVRFARAKGSKASNEKLPHEATSWSDMKQDLQKLQEESKNKSKREEFNKEKQENYNKFVKQSEKTQASKKWAEFPANLKTIKKKKKSLIHVTENDVTEEMIDGLCYSDPEVDEELKNLTEKVDKIIVQQKKGKKTILTPKIQIKKVKPKKQSNASDKLKNLTEKVDEIIVKQKESKKKNVDTDAPDELSTKIPPPKIQIKKVKHKKQSIKIPSIDIKQKTPKKKVENQEKTDELSTKIPSPKIQIKKVKHKKQSLKVPSVDIKQKTPKKKVENQEKTDELSTKIPSPKIQIKKVKHKKQSLKETSVDIKQETPKRDVENQEKTMKKRRKPIPVEVLSVNGKDESVVLYLGFPVLQSDHDRLVQLRKSLIAKGIPHNEVQNTLKRERRKAEKHLTRFKKLVCFNCRGTGHLLSECPMIENLSLMENTVTGICYKCGSTEHNARECKVSNNFKFARCFICKEQGHIASQCPDNPRGLYPKGGACKLCGNVTHLKKDCPQYREERKNDEMFLSIISNGNIEGVEDSVENNTKQKIVKKKVVKF